MYWASTAGRIRKVMAKHTKLVRQNVNPQGVPIVRLTKSGKQKTMAVKHIIASTWSNGLGVVGDNVMNIDGNKMNCRSNNLKYYSYFEDRTMKAAAKAEIEKYMKSASKEELSSLCDFIHKSQLR